MIHTWNVLGEQYKSFSPEFDSGFLLAVAGLYFLWGLPLIVEAWRARTRCLHLPRHTLCTCASTARC